MQLQHALQSCPTQRRNGLLSQGEEGNTLTILLNETLMRDIYAFGIMVQVRRGLFLNSALNLSAESVFHFCCFLLLPAAACG